MKFIFFVEYTTSNLNMKINKLKRNVEKPHIKHTDCKRDMGTEYPVLFQISVEISMLSGKKKKSQ
jgi:hypothetical protein